MLPNDLDELLDILDKGTYYVSNVYTDQRYYIIRLYSGLSSGPFQRYIINVVGELGCRTNCCEVELWDNFVKYVMTP